MILNFDPQFVNASRLLKNAIFIKDKESVSDEYCRKAYGLVVRLGVILDKEFLSRFIHLRFIATVTTGTDHIDEAFCKKNNIRIISLKGEKRFLASIRATPEHTWALILALIRKIPWAFDSVRKGKWDRQDFFGQELCNKCLGVIGLGRVGRQLSVYGRAFGMNVIFYDIRKIKRKPFAVKQVSLDFLLKTADIVSVNLPLDDSTKHFLKERYFRLMKRGAILVNTSRGAVIEEDALIRSLKEKRIAAAALDVINGEYSGSMILKKRPLIRYANKNNNLLISPHIAGSTCESMSKTSFFIAQKIKDFLAKAKR